MAIEPSHQFVEHHQAREIHDDALDAMSVGRAEPRQRGRMRSANLLFAGAIAEQLLKRDPQPLNVRLARAAMKPAPAAYSDTDKMALCVVRGVPDETGSDRARDAVERVERRRRSRSSG